MIDASTDVHVKSAQIQKKILGHLGIKSSNLVFEFQSVDGRVKLDLITINPRHNQSFLFHSATGYDKIDALNKVWEYVESYKDRENSYTIQWRTHGEKELHTSYFSARNIYEALDKLYYGRDMNTISVFSVVLNPVA
ncbi:MAG: hypothetical protein AAF363_06580 [Bacteroidota bacterium]